MMSFGFDDYFAGAISLNGEKFEFLVKKKINKKVVDENRLVLF